MAVLYYRLAKKEEGYMEEEFGSEYVEYKRHTGMFLPRVIPVRTIEQTSLAS